MSTSTKFDLDSASVHTFTDELIAKKCIQKVLENDQFIYVEGINHPRKFLSQEEFRAEKLKRENWENVSSAAWD